MHSRFFSLRWRYLLWGIIFGLLFPLVGGCLQLGYEGEEVSWAKWVELQAELPLLWIIDTAPIFLGACAFVIGHKQDLLQGKNQTLSVALEKKVEDLHQTNLQLVDEIQERINTEQDLAQALGTAKQASKAKTEFLSTMSHEIRTPLNAVIGMTGLLMETDLSGQQVDFVNTIKVGGESLLSVINDILDYSKIESGMLELEEQAFNTLDPLEDVSDLLVGKVNAKGLELIYEVDEEVPLAIYSDLTRLRQVLVNLVGNAIKFTEEGQIHIQVALQRRVEKKAEILFSVTDTGIGIPEDRKNRLFKSFSQVDASTTRKYGGTGLGLAICKKIVEHMGGRIWVESEVGEGSTFHFTILVKEAPSRPLEMIDALELFQGKRAILIDDNPTNVDIIERQCRIWGFDTRSFIEPQVALDYLSVNQDEAIDLVLTDMQMPELDGIELTRKLREMGMRTPVIMLSSLGNQLSPAEKPLFDYILTKPAKRQQLFNAIARVLGYKVTTKHPRNANQSFDQLPELRILLAEDNPVNQKVGKHMLTKLNQAPDVVGNGLEALDMCKKFEYDIILMDMQMPIMDGLQATEAILAYFEEKGGPSPTIIAMTANSSQADREACLAVGMKDFLSKPVQMRSLQAILKKWMPTQANYVV